MYGAIIGDIIGSPYEFDRGNKCKHFPLWNETSRFTDDTVLTIAVGEALMACDLDATSETISEAVVQAMRKWGRRYPDAGYGYRFSGWLYSHDPQPYGSFGNGSAMRVSAAGWLYDTLARTREVARATAVVTHQHPEGIKGAEAVASIIFLARQHFTKAQIRQYVIEEFAYDLSRSCAEIRPTYHHVESCQETVPEAMTAFLEGHDFEDVIRTAVSLGGDCDTLTAIAGSMSEAYYGVPDSMIQTCRQYLDERMLEVLDQLNERRKK